MTDNTEATQPEATALPQVPKQIPELDLEANSPKFERSRKGGYVEEVVDEWVKGIFDSTNRLINQYNRVGGWYKDALEKVEAQEAEINILKEDVDNAKREAEAAKAATAGAVAAVEHDRDEQIRKYHEEARQYIDRLNEAHDNEKAEMEAELARLRDALAQDAFSDTTTDDTESLAPVEVAEKTESLVEPVVVTEGHAQPEHTDDFIRMGAELLERARNTSAEFIEEAKQKAEQIRNDAESEAANIKRDAEESVEQLKQEAAELTEVREHNLSLLEDYFSTQLDAVRTQRKPYNPSDLG